MRIAAMIVGILLAIWTFLEGTVLSNLSNWANDEDRANLAGMGVLSSLLMGVAAVLVLSIPLVSCILFSFAAIVSFSAGASGYGNHYLYGSIAAGLAVMSFFGWLGKRKQRREVEAERQRQVDRDNRLASLVRDQSIIPGTPLSNATVSNHWLLADLDAKSRIALFDVLPHDEEILFVVRGENATLVGTTDALVSMPAKPSRRTKPVVIPYADVVSSRIEPSRKGGRLLYEVNGSTRVVELANPAQVEQGMVAVREMGSWSPPPLKGQEVPELRVSDVKVVAASPEPSRVFCSYCGSRNDPGARFCAECGSALKTTSAPA